LTPIVAAFALVWGGSRIAPYRKIEAAIALFGGWMLLAGVSLTLGLMGVSFGTTHYSVQLGGSPFAGSIIGAALGLYFAHRQTIAPPPNSL
jgi:hypothetical protein